MDIKISDENVIHIYYKWNKKKKLITISKTVEEEPEFFVLENETSQKNASPKGEKYNVDCDLGEDSWSGECDGKFSCGRMIYKCLEAGGCAEICEKKIAYAPQNKTFYFLN